MKKLFLVLCTSAALFSCKQDAPQQVASEAIHEDIRLAAEKRKK